VAALAANKTKTNEPKQS